MPDAARLAVGEMAKLDVSEFPNEGFPDLDLYGAGLHSILPGGIWGCLWMARSTPCTGGGGKSTPTVLSTTGRPSGANA